MGRAFLASVWGEEYTLLLQAIQLHKQVLLREGALPLIKLNNISTKIGEPSHCFDTAPLSRSITIVPEKFQSFYPNLFTILKAKVGICPILDLKVPNTLLQVQNFCMKFAWSVIASLHPGDFLLLWYSRMLALGLS